MTDVWEPAKEWKVAAQELVPGDGDAWIARFTFRSGIGERIVDISCKTLVEARAKNEADARAELREWPRGESA